MAGLDTSIALGIKPVDFGDPNEGRMNALRAQMMQMQMQQGQFNMMKAQRDMQYQDQQATHITLKYLVVQLILVVELIRMLLN